MPYLMPGPEWAQHVALPLVGVAVAGTLGYVYLWNKERKEKKKNKSLEIYDDMISTKGNFRDF